MVLLNSWHVIIGHVMLSETRSHNTGYYRGYENQPVLNIRLWKTWHKPFHAFGWFSITCIALNFFMRIAFKRIILLMEKGIRLAAKPADHTRLHFCSSEFNQHTDPNTTHPWRQVDELNITPVWRAHERLNRAVFQLAGSVLSHVKLW